MAGYDYDLFTLGAGSGGVAGSRRAAGYGARVGIAEGRRIGGTCVLRGCVPKKLLVYSAEYADDFADSAGYGWTVPAPSFDWPALIAGKNHETDRLHGIYVSLLEKSGVAIHEGYAKLVDPHTIEIKKASGTERVTAERIMIATGGHPVMADIPGIGLAITSDEALDLPQFPERVVIVGGGYIAVEFAGIFARLGAQVTMVIRGDALLRGFDRDMRLGLGEAMVKRGITVLSGADVVRIEAGPVAILKDGRRLPADQILYATGRKPNTKGIGLENVGIPTDGAGAIGVDPWSATIQPHIYAVGDVTNRLNLTPVAIAEARALAETLFNNNPTRFDPEGVATAVFSAPTIATVGLTEEAARALGRPIDIYRSGFRPMKHTLSHRDERTLMKLVVDRASDIVLGCHMLGSDAPEIIQGLAVALKCGATKRQFDQTVGIHPTAAEEFVTMRDKAPDPVGT
jgi:glutathione reductase (NADPH)